MRTEAAEFMQLNPGEAVKYDEYWADASGGEEQVSGKDARSVLTRASNVSKTQLRLIWEIADHRQEGCLDRAQFLIALRLIALAQRGAEISVKGLRNFVGIQLIPSISPRPPPPAPEASAPEAGAVQPQGDIQEQEKRITWTVSNDVLARYDNFFGGLDMNATGFVDGAAGVAFFGKSGLPRPVLKQIWQLADITRDGKLSRDEFRVAMHIVAELRSGRAVVADLPKALDPHGSFWLRSEEEAAMFHQTQQATLAAQQAQVMPQQQVQAQPGSLGPGGSIRGGSPTSVPQPSGNDDILSNSVRRTLPPAADGDLLGGAVPRPSLTSTAGSAPLSPHGGHEKGEDAISLREKLRVEQQEALRAQRELELMKEEMKKLRLDKEKIVSSSREQDLRDQSAEVEEIRKAYHDVLAAKARAEEEASRARLEASQLKQESMRMPESRVSPAPSPRKQPQQGSMRDTAEFVSPVPSSRKQAKSEFVRAAAQVSPVPSPRKQAKPEESIWSESSARPSKERAAPVDTADTGAAALKLPPASASSAIENVKGVDHGAAASADDFFGGKASPGNLPFSVQAPPSLKTDTPSKRSGSGPAGPARLISDDSMSESDDDDFWGSSGAGAKPKLRNSSAQGKGAGGDPAAKGEGFGNDLDEWAF